MTNSKKCEDVCLKQFKDPNVFMEYVNDVNDACNIIKDYNQRKNGKY